MHSCILQELLMYFIISMDPVFDFGALTARVKMTEPHCTSSAGHDSITPQSSIRAALSWHGKNPLIEKGIDIRMAPTLLDQARLKTMINCAYVSKYPLKLAP